ncbi:MAG TPA: RNA methyltransferase [Acidimicrobiales bacterium]|nr:RNA methyltransferase [Acidimicrobiales bacterium]
MAIHRVDDPDDPRLVELTGLTDAAARASMEAEHGCFVVEGLLALDAALRSAYPVRSVLVAEPKLPRVLALLGDAPVATDGIDVHVGSQALLEQVTGFAIHRGVVASAGRLPLPSPAEVVRGARRVLVAEAVNDHENLGALFRNAAAFGVDAVLLDPRCADPLYRRSVRVSLGHVLRVPWARTGPLAEAVAGLHDAGLVVLALTPAGERTVHEVAASRRDQRLAWLVGAEGPGLDRATMDAADERVRIPIAAGVDSLNVATAAAVALAVTAPLR